MTTSAAAILRLERMSHAEKLIHWGSKNPWVGLRLPSKVTHIPVSHVRIDNNGHITKMPKLIGRPCFGQVTAFLRHGGIQQTWIPRMKKWSNSRCMRCPVRTACEFVVNTRLNATPALRAAYQEWTSMGGRATTWQAAQPGIAMHRYRDLLRILDATVPFSSVNDKVAEAHYDQIEAARLKKDRIRNKRARARERDRKIQAGQFDDEVLGALNRERIWRRNEHRIARSHAGGPRRLNGTSSHFDALVWLCKTRLELGGKAVNASSVAKELQLLGEEAERTHNALRSKVAGALGRVALLERTSLPGGSEPIWPKFTQAELVAHMEYDPLQA